MLFVNLPFLLKYYSISHVEASPLSKSAYKVAGGTSFQLFFTKATKIAETTPPFNALAPDVSNVAEIKASAVHQEKVNFYAVVSAIGYEKSVKRGTVDLRDVELLDDFSPDDPIIGTLWHDVARKPMFAVNDVVYINNGELNVYLDNKKVNFYGRVNIEKRDDQRSRELQQWFSCRQGLNGSTSESDLEDNPSLEQKEEEEESEEEEQDSEEEEEDIEEEEEDKEVDNQDGDNSDEEEYGSESGEVV